MYSVFVCSVLSVRNFLFGANVFQRGQNYVLRAQFLFSAEKDCLCLNFLKTHNNCNNNVCHDTTGFKGNYFVFTKLSFIIPFVTLLN